jgi:hypothetical protein
LLKVWQLYALAAQLGDVVVCVAVTRTLVHR